MALMVCQWDYVISSNALDVLILDSKEPAEYRVRDLYYWCPLGEHVGSRGPRILVQ